MIIAPALDWPPRGDDQRSLSDFVRTWTQAVQGTSYVSMTHVEIETFLYGLAEQLAVALRPEPSCSVSPGCEIGYEIGARLVAADFDAPEGLGRTVGVIHDRLLSDLGLAGDGPRRRLSNLLEALITGYSRALR